MSTLDPIVKLVWTSGVGLVVLAFSLFLLTLASRLWLMGKERRRKQFLALWTPFLAQSLVHAPHQLPRISAADSYTFLELWNYFHASFRGEIKERLNHIACLSGMNRVAMRMLKQWSVRKRLMAIATLGHLRERSAWAELTRIAHGENPTLSLAAAKALVDIDARAATPILIPLVASRTNWSSAKVAAVLKEMEIDVISEPLARAAFSVSPDNTARLIRYLEATRCTSALPVLRWYVKQGTPEDRVVAACLRFFGRFGSREDLEMVRSYLSHPNWLVRLEAVRALGAIGIQEDVESLIRRLVDENWWVRYRAAEALTGLPFVGRERVRQIQEEQTDQSAREILAPFLFAA
ncbi:MAG: HEAT repeat domain-containing protein [Deltaproteobacteria bacterium]|nr:HEAT repeat domain-containing protein [Deltaproteobacteria bacterium]